jgi:hypothetical protein
LQIAYISAVSPDATYTAQQQITELLRQRHKLGPNEPDDFTVRNMSDIAEAANQTKQHDDFVCWLVSRAFRCWWAASAS